MNTRLLITLCGAFLMGTVMLNGDALAQGGGGPGGGGGGGDGDVTPPDYGDLIILYRDDGGVPLLDGNSCQQPIGFPDPEFCNQDDDEHPYYAPLLRDPLDEVWLVPVNPATCAVDTAYAACTDEVNFGRTNTARSSDAVLESQLEDVIIGLAIADCTTLDPAGRMVHSRYVDELVTTTIDSPLQNLAVYKQLMLTGTIGPDLPQGADPLLTAARGLGVAMDKAGKVNVDLVVYINEILGLTDLDTPTELPKICTLVKEEVMGSIELVQKCFLDYSTYGYTRGPNFESLPSPAYIPVGNPTLGIFESLSKIDDNLYKVAEGPILQTVFPDGFNWYEPGFTNGNIGGFAQAADDTRAVINFMHNWPVPADGETAIPCEPRPDQTPMYDLAISEQSGLQVPKNYVNGGEREFFVNVGNLAGDTANGTVTVVATGEEGPLGTWAFVIENLSVDQTASFTQIFTIDTIGDQIDWTATVAANPPGTDPNPSNNEVSATSRVRASGGGGGH